MRSRHPMYRKPNMEHYPVPPMEQYPTPPVESEPMPSYYDYNYKYRRHHWPRWWYYYNNDYDWYDYDFYDDDWYYYSKIYRQGVEHGRSQAMKIASQSNCMPTEPPAPPPVEPTKG